MPFRSLRRGALLAAWAGVFFCSQAYAQIVVGVDDPVEPLWNIDVTNNAASTALTGFPVVGMASDEANQTLYFLSNTVTLWRWTYGVAGAQPQQIGTTQNTSGANISLNGLGFNQTTGQLFASRALDSTAGPEGFYQINTTTAVATLDFGVNATNYSFDGLDYDAASGKFYGLSDPSVSGVGTPGLYEVDLVADTLTLVTPLPTTSDQFQDIDGLAVGNGRAYMVEDKAVQAGGRIYVFNLTTMQYETPLLVPWFFSETFAGATYSPTLSAAMQNGTVPEPAVALLLAGAALVARRRA